MAHVRADPVRLGALTPWLALLIGSALVSQGRVHLFARSSILTAAQKTNRFTVGRAEPAKRGTIYFRDGKILAQSEDHYQLGLNFSKVPQSEGFFMALSEASGIAASEMIQASANKVASQFWPEPIGQQQAAAIQQIKFSWRADGISLNDLKRRDYPLAESTACLLGCFRDAKPIGGLEYYFNKELHGTDGYREGLVDRTGAFLPMRMTEANRARANGKNLTLTLDSSLQMTATQALRATVEKNKADSGVAIVIDPKTGDILAMANWPSYDPTGDLSQASKINDLNPNYMARFEPGSMFKILTLAEGLDLGVVHDSDKVECHGVLNYNASWHVHCDEHHGNRAHGTTTLEQAIARSCNVSAATWALKIGHTRMVSFVENLGLLKPTALGVPGEVKGQFDYKEYAKPLQLMTMGFGQSLTATPAALASAFAMLGNGGLRMQPRLVKAVGGAITPLKQARQIVKTETAAKVLRLMEAVIETDEGTGAKLRIPGYRLAGKTGTAQKTNRSTGRVGGAGYVSSFVGFVPAQNPKAMILVMVDHPQGQAYYGALVAGPVFHELAKAVIRTFHIPPTKASKSNPTAAMACSTEHEKKKAGHNGIR